MIDHHLEIFFCQKHISLCIFKKIVLKCISKDIIIEHIYAFVCCIIKPRISRKAAATNPHSLWYITKTNPLMQIGTISFSTFGSSLLSLFMNYLNDVPISMICHLSPTIFAIRMPSTYPLSPPDDRQLNIYRSPLNIDQQLSNLNRHFPLSFYRYAEESKLLTNDNVPPMFVPAAAIILSALFSFRTHTHTHRSSAAVTYTECTAASRR